MFKELLDDLLYKLKEITASRLFPVTMLFAAFFGMLVFRMYRLQIVEGAQAELSVQKTTIRTVYTTPTRGNIYDRNGELLAYNRLVQNVTVADNGAYANGYERNEMLLRLIELLDRHGETVVQTIPISYDPEQGYIESFSSDNARQRFIRDMLGKKSITELSEEEAALTTEAILENYYKRFGIGYDSEGNTVELDPAAALKCLYIRYSLYSNYYVRYNASVVAEDVSEGTVAAVRELSPQLLGVEIEQSYVRAYNDPEYFCHILGYTGYASAEEIEKLNEDGGEYVSGDMIGKTGIEAYMEQYLRGTPGQTTIYVNNLGQVQQLIEEVPSKPGNDVYLSVDATLTKGIYHLIEQKLAGILVAHLVNEDADPAEEEHLVPIKKAYYQLLANHTLDIDAFGDDDAGVSEKRLYKAFAKEQSRILALIRRELTGLSPRAYISLSEEEQAYFTELYSVLLSRGILVRDDIDTDSELYAAYRTSGEISLQEYLRGALEQGWIDMTRLKTDEKYSSSEQVYRLLADEILLQLEDSFDFSCAIYRHLIEKDAIQRCDIACALFEQGVLEEDRAYYSRLREGDEDIAYAFLKAKISAMEITPAQLAIDPYSGAATVVDVETGETLAMVSYPGYDNNRMNDTVYYAGLLSDEASPLYNTATQARTTPGSVFKLVTTAAGLETGAITPDTYLKTTGVFTGGPLDIHCWFYPEAHGYIDAVTALQASCNDFIAQLIYRISQTDGDFDDAYGLAVLRKFAFSLGLGEKSGVEINEASPYVTDTSAMTSAIGQGTSLYTNSQLARYVTAVATKGRIYSLTLLSARKDSDGAVLESYSGKLARQTEMAEETWTVLHKGMRAAALNGSMASVISQNVAMAGKTGTAEENASRPDHATFISFAPYDDPEIAVAVTIPHGYAAGNSAEIGGYIYDFYYDYMSYDDILNAEARDAGGNDVQE